MMQQKSERKTHGNFVKKKWIKNGEIHNQISEENKYFHLLVLASEESKVANMVLQEVYRTTPSL